MHAQPPPLPYFYYTSPYTVPAYGTVSSSQMVLLDVNWRNSWPTVRTAIISFLMLISSAAIIGLDIGYMAIEGNKSNGTSKLGIGTSNVGAGVWSGTVSFIAGIFIVTIIFVRNRRVAATFALFAVILALLFSITLIGLEGNAVQNNLSMTGRTRVEKIQDILLIFILSFALLIMTLCLLFCALYTTVFFSPYTRRMTMR